MPSRFPVFDRSRLKLAPLACRCHDLGLSHILSLEPADRVDPVFGTVGDRIVQAHEVGASVVMMLGAHVIRSGVQRYLIDLMERGLLDCIAVNGAGVIHDFEFALVGATTESVARYITDGCFGFWDETGRINDIIAEGHRDEMGLGEAVGKVIETERFPYRDISVLAAGYRLGIPVTAHVGIGYDIIHQHPNCDGAALGATSYTDFLRFTHVLERLEKGVVMNFGSAVMAPEVYLKALAMVRNVARQGGRRVSEFTTLVCDLTDIPAGYRSSPEKSDPRYYFRPWKTMLVRTVADGGESFYFKGDHAVTIPQLWTSLSS